MKRYNLFGLLFLLLFGACSYLDDYSQDLVVAKNVEHLDELMIGSCYFKSENLTSMASGEVAWFLNILDDDVNTVGVLNKRADEITNMNSSYFGYTTWQYEVGRSLNGSNLQADNGTWNALYQHINAVNVVLSELDNIDIPTDEEAIQATRIRGECHFLRAQFYFLLVNLYGNAYAPATATQTLGVPLKLTAYVEHDKDKNTQFERASVADVYAQIISDLDLALQYLNDGSASTSLFRVSPSAAELLLSRVYLYMQDWENARIHAENVIKNNILLSYSSFGSEDYVISQDNAEVLFSQGSLNTKSNIQGIGGSFCVSKELYELYADDDYRKQLYFTDLRHLTGGTVTLTDSLALNKYDRTLDRSYVSDIFTLRTAEAYLNAAEAYAMQNDVSAALQLLNDFRRTRIQNYTDEVYGQQELVQEIRDERRKELCFEGHRWFDLRRYAVCEQFPFTKTIRRFFARYNESTYLLTRIDIYELLPNDLAYTFQIPKAVLDFDTGMGSNPREQRTVAGTVDLNKLSDETTVDSESVEP